LYGYKGDETLLKEMALFRTSKFNVLYKLAQAEILSGKLELNRRHINAVNKTFAIKDVSVITMAGSGVLNNQTVIVEDGIIRDIGNSEAIDIGGIDNVINGRGMYLMPGLADMHVHIENPEYLLLFIARGVTKVRNMGGIPFVNKYKNLIDKRIIVGPAIYNAGPIIDGNNPQHRWSISVNSTDGIRKLLSKHIATGYKYIKIYNNLDKEVYKEIMDVSKELGIKVIGHLPKAVQISEMISEGQYSLEHAGHLTSLEDADKLARSDTWLCPTLIIYNYYRKLDSREELLKGPNLKYVHPSIVRFWKRAGVWSVPREELYMKINRFHQLKGKLLAGTDCTNPFVIPGFSLHEELQELVNAGLTNYEALRACTYNAAQCLEISHKSGTIEKGKEADFILLSGNPLEDIKNTEKLEGVYVNKAWYSKDKLNSILSDIAEKYQKMNK
jgi:imidazolonepropionase-like amidohydrolase